MSAADPTAALAYYLIDALGAATTGTIKEGLRVFAPELPDSEEQYMPAACVVVLPDPSGGSDKLFGRTNLPVRDSRLAIYCYGSTRLESQNLSREVEAALFTFKVSVWNNVKLYWARHEGGAWGDEAKIDPNTLWPVAIVFCQVLHDREPR